MEFRCLVALTPTKAWNWRAESPDAILLDIRLPDRSGLSVLQQLKDNPATRHIPVHVVSSRTTAARPCTWARSAMRSSRPRASSWKTCSASARKNRSQKIKRVLLVEDDERQRDSVVQLISDDDVEIAAVGSAARKRCTCCARRSSTA
jgi:CheY-like chemotaxis protein